MKRNSIKKKILIIASHSGSGFVHIDKLLPSLIDRGFDVTFWGWDRNNENIRSFNKNGVQFKMIFSGWGFANKWLAVALPLWVMRATFELIRLQKNIPVMMAIDFDSALPQAIAQCFNKIPFIYNIRDNFAMRTTLPKFLRPIIKRLDKFVINKALNIISRIWRIGMLSNRSSQKSKIRETAEKRCGSSFESNGRGRELYVCSKKVKFRFIQREAG